MPALTLPIAARGFGTRQAGIFVSALAALGLLLLPASAAAHGGAAHVAEYGWTLDPWVVIPLLLTALLFTGGAARLMRRAGRGRPMLLVRIGLFAAGLAALAGALLSPLHAIGEALFTAHMIEHEIVMAVAAPLLVLARPLGLLLHGLPRPARLFCGRWLKARPARRLWSAASHGGIATALHGAVIWIWHMPVAFDAAVNELVLHRLQHLSFLASALLFWWAMAWTCSRGVAAWHIFATMMHTSLLGALMALSPVVLYAAQTRLAPEFGLSPLEDQQLAGMLMWVPAGTIYAGAALAMLAMWINQSGRETSHAANPL